MGLEDDDLDYAESKLLNLCPSCKQKESDHEESCVRSAVTGIMADTHFNVQFTFNEPNTVQIVLSGVPGQRLRQINHELMCCRQDYNTLLQTLEKAREKGSEVMMCWD